MTMVAVCIVIEPYTRWASNALAVYASGYRSLGTVCDPLSTLHLNAFSRSRMTICCIQMFTLPSFAPLALWDWPGTLFHSNDPCGHCSFMIGAMDLQPSLIGPCVIVSCAFRVCKVICKTVLRYTPGCFVVVWDWPGTH